MGREFPDRPVVGVGAVILQRGASGGLEVLLVRRANPPLQGEWSLPGGVVELGERLEAAIIREVKEETGLHVRPFQVVEVLDSIVRQGGGAPGFSSEGRPEEAARVRFHYVLIDYLCGVEGGELGSSSDASEVCWLAVDSLREHGEFALQCRTIEVIAKAVTMTSDPTGLLKQ